MEFERALFRVYERSIEGLVRDQPYVDHVPLTRPSKVCALVVWALGVWSLTLLACTAALHVTFVGDPGCIGRALHDIAVATNASQSAPSEGPPLHRWLVGQPPQLPPQLPPQQPQQRHRLRGQQLLLQQAPALSPSSSSPSPLEMDDVLQIKVLTSNPSLVGGGNGWSLSLNLFPGLDGMEGDAAAGAAGAAAVGAGTVGAR
jgi:hypothetical protein